MDTVSLQAQARSEGTKAKHLRRQRLVPCVLYGNDVENQKLQCDYSELFRVYSTAGASTIVDLDVAGKAVPVLIHAIDFEPVSDHIIHVDFYAVDMKKEIEARVPVTFEGESPAVKDLGGVLVTVIDHLTVRCLPADLPHTLPVDLSTLETFQDALHVSDVTIPDGVVVQEAGSAMLATVQEPRKEAAPTDEAAGEETEEEAEEGEEAKTEEKTE